jgi:transketolase
MENNAITTIVELLFGEQMRNYEKRFAKLQETSKENQDSNNVRMGQLHQDMMQQLANLEHRLAAQMNKNHEDLVARLEMMDEQKLDRRQLGKMLIEIGSQISA